MNNIQLNKIINDEDYVSMINKISKSIYDYFKATNGNYYIIEKNFKLLNNKYKTTEEIKIIMSTYLANNENLKNFISDMKISFKNLKILRKEYLDKTLNNINELLIQTKNNSKTFNNNFNFNNYNNIGKNKNNDIIDLIMSLDNYTELLGYYSEEKKDEFREILSLIINEMKDNKNDINNVQDFSLLNKEIDILKNQLNEEQNKRKVLYKKCNELLKINKMDEKKLSDKDSKII